MHCGENPYRFIVFLAGFMLVAQGCVMPVEIAPPAERQVFVKCILEKGNPIQRADAVFYLANAAFVTGQVLCCDGGYTI